MKRLFISALALWASIAGAQEGQIDITGTLAVALNSAAITLTDQLEAARVQLAETGNRCYGMISGVERQLCFDEAIETYTIKKTEALAMHRQRGIVARAAFYGVEPTAEAVMLARINAVRSRTIGPDNPPTIDWCEPPGCPLTP